MEIKLTDTVLAQYCQVSLQTVFRNINAYIKLFNKHCQTLNLKKFTWDDCGDNDESNILILIENIPIICNIAKYHLTTARNYTRAFMCIDFEQMGFDNDPLFDKLNLILTDIESENADFKSHKYDDKIISMDGFKDSILSNTKTGSIEQAILSIYWQLPLRDDIDLYTLEIDWNKPIDDITSSQAHKKVLFEYLSEEYPEDQIRNLLVFDSSDFSIANVYIVLRKTKTVPRNYIQEIYKLEDWVANNVKAYLQELTIGRNYLHLFLFRKSNVRDKTKKPRLYRRIIDAMRKIGMGNGGINYIRRLHAEGSVTSKTKNARTIKARQSGHTLKTQSNYLQSKNE